MGFAHPPSRRLRPRRPTGGGLGLTLRSIRSGIRRFWRIAYDANITGLASMIAYNMLLGVIPIALLGLFVAGHVLSSGAVEHSVVADLREVFPGAAEGTLDSLLDEVRNSTTSTGVLALIASVWLGSSFWGALDTAFTRIYDGPSRGWLRPKRFALSMLIVVLLFMVATVAVPTAQSILRAGASVLPFDLAHVADLVYLGSLALSLAIIFGCLVIIYTRVPHRKMAWKTVWPGALGATV